MSIDLDIDKATVTLTLRQVLDITIANTNKVLERLGYDKWIHRAELERSTGWSRRKVDSYIIKGLLKTYQRDGRTWFLRTDVAQIIDQERSK